MVSLLFISISACDNFLGVNENPNEPEFVEANLQLPAVLGYFSYRVLANEPVRVSSQWIQQTAWNGVQPSADTYNYLESDPNNFWGIYSYVSVMNNAKTMIEQTEGTESRAYAGIGRIVFAWNMSIITDFFNEAPLSEAFDPTNPSPAYDTQEQIYEAVFDMLDEAIAELSNPGVINPGSDDQLYGGNLTKWIQLANTLKARLHMRLTEAPGNTPTARANAALNALQGGFESNADDADYAYVASAGSENPWFQFAIDGKWDTRNQLSQHYVDLLKSLQDPRLPVQARQAGAVVQAGLDADFSPVPFDPATMYALDDSTYWGHENARPGIGAGVVSSIGSFYSAADAPLTWISYAEAKFLEAEATLLTSGEAAADPIYREAITASMEKLGVDAGDIANYLAALPALGSLPPEDAYEHLITQKYIATFLTTEPYNDWRRTGYPSLRLPQPAPDEDQLRVDQIPRRFPYPVSELQNNADNALGTGVPAGLPSLTYKVWWDTRD